VHQNCLQRWVDEKQKGNSFKRVQCQQCQTEYIIVLPNMGVLADLLEGIDNVIRRSSPFIAAGIFVGSFYWTAVTYGAITSKLTLFFIFVVTAFYVFSHLEIKVQALHTSRMKN